MQMCSPFHIITHLPQIDCSNSLDPSHKETGGSSTAFRNHILEIIKMYEMLIV